MARISYGTSTPFGSKINQSLQAIKLAQAFLPRCKQVADSLTAGGTNTSALEGSAEFGVATGQGANFYAALQSLDAALFTTPGSWAPVQATIDLDQG
jgi:hypothetical protein